MIFTTMHHSKRHTATIPQGEYDRDIGPFPTEIDLIQALENHGIFIQYFTHIETVEIGDGWAHRWGK